MEDRYDLKRFLDAQERDYKRALKEIRNGHKQSHWIWYIFPQMKGLGYSHNSNYYGVSCIEEARAYLENETLGKRLYEICDALLCLDTDDPYEVMGDIDARKLCSSMTLFNEVRKDDIFKRVLDKYFRGNKDEATLKLLNK